MERPNRLAALIQILICASIAWMAIPSHTRSLILMRLADGLKKRSQRLARSTGRLGMSRELAGDHENAQTAYKAAYRLMTDAQDRIARWYDKLRGAT